ncbi:MAG: hypothetical protein ACYSU0_15850 [Planctomycetota bacterium]|jgi:hypothetical protein
MRLVAQSRVPSGIPYTHLGYIASPGPFCGKIGIFAGLLLMIPLLVRFFRGRIGGR